MNDIITTTLTITMAMVLNMQECHCDGQCGIGPSGSEGPYQILSFRQMELLGCEKDNSKWWLDFYDARGCVQKFVDWLKGIHGCIDPRMTWAAWNWGIGNVLSYVERHGCSIRGLPARVRSFANMDRGLMCYTERLDEWSPQRKPTELPEWPECVNDRCFY